MKNNARFERFMSYILAVKHTNAPTPLCRRYWHCAHYDQLTSSAVGSAFKASPPSTHALGGQPAYRRRRMQEAEKNRWAAPEVATISQCPLAPGNNLLSSPCNNQPEFQNWTKQTGRGAREAGERKKERERNQYCKTKRLWIQSILWSSCQSLAILTRTWRVCMFHLFICHGRIANHAKPMHLVFAAWKWGCQEVRRNVLLWPRSNSDHSENKYFTKKVASINESVNGVIFSTPSPALTVCAFYTKTTTTHLRQWKATMQPLHISQIKGHFYLKHQKWPFHSR